MERKTLMKLINVKHVAMANSTRMLIALLLGLFFAVQLSKRQVDPGNMERVTDVENIEHANETHPISPLAEN